MSALVQLAGADVLGAQIHMPRRGWWWAQAKLDTQTAPTGKVTIEALGGFTLSGFVVPKQSGVFNDSAYVQVVGGAGGLDSLVRPGAFQNALVRDVMSSILGSVGERSSSTIDAGTLAMLLSQWLLAAQTAATALDNLSYAAGAETWRVLADGSVWMGNESWPSEALPSTSDVLFQYPDDGRYLIGCQTPALMPGVMLEDVGANIGAVDHYITADSIRSVAWQA